MFGIKFVRYPTFITYFCHKSSVLWTALPYGSTDYTSDPQTVLLDSWTSPPSGSMDSHIFHDSKCSSYIVIVLLLCSVHVTSIACLSVLGRGIPPLWFSQKFLFSPDSSLQFRVFKFFSHPVRGSKDRGCHTCTVCETP